MESSIFEWLIRFMYEQCGFLCHQLETRSITIAEVPLPVCSRCTGIYAGAFFSFLVLWFTCRWNENPQKSKWLYWTSGSTLSFLLFDVYAGSRMYGDLHPVRFISGYLFGFIVFFLIWGWTKLLTVEKVKAVLKPVRTVLFFTTLIIGLSLSFLFNIFFTAEPWFFYLSLTAVFTGIWILYSALNTLIFFWIFSNLRRRCSSAKCFWLSHLSGAAFFVIQMMFIQWTGLSI